MCAEDCRNRLRIRLSDDNGVLRFEEFEIVGAPECQDIAATLREYLVGRTLPETDLDYLRRLRCPADGGRARAVIEEVEKCQRLFDRKQTDRGATC